MKKVSPSQAANAFKKAIRDQDLALFIGAGVSMLPPSSLPGGHQLKLDMLNLVTVYPALRKHRDKIVKSEKFLNAIPELIFQPIYENIGTKLYQIFDCLSYATPNHVHHRIAELVEKKKTIVYTTNFDALLEDCGAEEESIIHLHGSMLNPDNMIIRIYQVGRGVHQQMTRNFRTANKNKTLFVFGYSGNDQDILTLLSNTKFKAIYWLSLSATDKKLLDNVSRIRNQRLFVFESTLEKFFSPNSAKRKTAAVNKAINADLKKVSYFESVGCVQSIYYVTGEFHAALALCEKTLQDTRRKIPNDLRAWYHTLAADNLVCIGTQPDKAIKHINKAIDLYKNKNYELAEAYSALGNIYVQRDVISYRIALRNLNIALRYANLVEIKKLTAVERDLLLVLFGKIYNNTGLAYANGKQFDKAIIAYRSSLRYKKRAGNITAIAITAANMCHAYCAMGDNKYKYWARKAEYILTQYNAYYRLGYLYRELGIRIFPKNQKKGLDYLHKALRVYENFVPAAKFDIKLTKEQIEQAII